MQGLLVQAQVGDWSVFTSALYKKLEAKWLYPNGVPCKRFLFAGVEEKATFDAAVMVTSEVRTF
jgi:hypothetical protein